MSQDAQRPLVTAAGFLSMASESRRGLRLRPTVVLCFDWQIECHHHSSSVPMSSYVLVFNHTGLIMDYHTIETMGFSIKVGMGTGFHLPHTLNQSESGQLISSWTQTKAWCGHMSSV